MSQSVSMRQQYERKDCTRVPSSELCTTVAVKEDPPEDVYNSIEHRRRGDCRVRRSSIANRSSPPDGFAQSTDDVSSLHRQSISRRRETREDAQVNDATRRSRDVLRHKTHRTSSLKSLTIQKKQADMNSIPITLSTQSCTTSSEESSSCFNAMESKDTPMNEVYIVNIPSCVGHSQQQLQQHLLRSSSLIVCALDSEFIDDYGSLSDDIDVGYVTPPPFSTPECPPPPPPSAYHHTPQAHVVDKCDQVDHVEVPKIEKCSFKSKPSSSFKHTNRRTKQNTTRSEREVQITAKQMVQEQALALDAWNGVAKEYYRRVEPFTSLFVPHLLSPHHLVDADAADQYKYLRGLSVLDVAAGTGAASLYAASRGASFVTASDFSTKMLKMIRRRIASVPESDDQYPCHPSCVIETKMADGMCLPREWTHQYDIVCSNFGVIFVPQLSKGLAEMVKCTRPGGKVCLSGWGSSEETRAFSIFPSAIKRCGFGRKWLKAQSASRRQLLALAGIQSDAGETKQKDKEKKRAISLTPNYYCPTKRVASSETLLQSLMVDAGLENVQVEGPISNELRLDTAEDYWHRFVLASPNVKRLVDECFSEEETLKLKDAVMQILEEEMDGRSGIVLNASAYVAFGTKCQ